MKKSDSIGRSSVFRPLWWFVQIFIVGFWEIALFFVLIFQGLCVLFTGKTEASMKRFTSNFIEHVKCWSAYTFWVNDDRPEFIVYN